MLAVTIGLSVAVRRAVRPRARDSVDAAGAGAGAERDAAASRATACLKVLVVGQIALLMLLLMGAGLFVRTLSNLQSIAVGFNRDNLLLFELNAPQAGYPEAAAAAFYDDLRRRFAEIPGSAR